MGMDNLARIEDRIDKTAAGATAISMTMGGVQFQTMIELMEFSKLMAVSGAAVPVHLRGNPGACLAICTRALRFGFDPFSLAEHSYSMKKSTKTDNGWEDVETIAYDSFVIAAIINAHAPLTGRLETAYEGEGDDRVCIISALSKGTTKPLTLRSPKLADRIKAIGKSEKGNLRGSPLWITKPDQQLAYDTRRDFCRLHFPEILLGWYDREEFEEHGPDNARDVTPKPDVGKRLKGAKDGARGFSADGVTKALEHKPAETADGGTGQAPATPETVMVSEAPAAEAKPEPARDGLAEWLADKIKEDIDTATTVLTIDRVELEILDEIDKRVDLQTVLKTACDARRVALTPKGKSK